ncbi:MAG: heme biosynthesis HemY N-terminal domain-containing protein [Exilibacterium sp.]
MRHIFLLFCLALLSGSALLYLVQLEQGYILISLGKTTLEMSFWVGLFTLLLILFGTWVLCRVTKSGVRSVATGVQRVIYGHSRIVQKRIFQGLIDFIEGYWKQAK